MRYHPDAHYQPPGRTYYRPYYTRWYAHPYYRYRYSTVGYVNFGWDCDPWRSSWRAPSRSGFYWMDGGYYGGYYRPGYYRPLNTTIIYRNNNYDYVPGWWSRDRYVEGYYRPQQRADGDWSWVEGYYLDDGQYVWGYWMPNRGGPEGYMWEPGFHDGETYVDGFWRPRYRRGFGWIGAFYDDDGIFHAGYWMPMDAEPGYTWVPGWFDGNEWVVGYWVLDEDFRNADVDNYQPAEGWDDGWQGVGDGEFIDDDDAPLALPVNVN